jgi:hypothetical protein
MGLHIFRINCNACHLVYDTIDNKCVYGTPPTLQGCNNFNDANEIKNHFFKILSSPQFKDFLKFVRTKNSRDFILNLFDLKLQKLF